MGGFLLAHNFSRSVSLLLLRSTRHDPHPCLTAVVPKTGDGTRASPSPTRRVPAISKFQAIALYRTVPQRPKTGPNTHSTCSDPLTEAVPFDRKFDQYPYRSALRKFKRRYREWPGNVLSVVTPALSARPLPINANGLPGLPDKCRTASRLMRLRNDKIVVTHREHKSLRAIVVLVPQRNCYC